MSATRSSCATILAVFCCLSLAGCAAQPDRSEVVDRYVLELEGAMDLGSVGDEGRALAEGYVDEMFDGKCGDALIRNSAFPEDTPAFRFAFEMTCLMYFEDDMSESQIDTAKQLLLDEVAEDAN